MNADIMKGKWMQVKGRVREQWGKLTDDDVDRISGNVEQLVGTVQERYGYAKDRASQEVDAFLANFDTPPAPGTTPAR